MAEQKCPMCGKLNPPELDVCQFCEARLKPLLINPSEDSQSSPTKRSSETPSEESGTPDWLRSLRDRQEETEFEPNEEDLPGWPQQEEGENSGLPSGEIEASDWLASLRDPASSEDDVFMEVGQEDGEEHDGDAEDVWAPPGQGAEEEEAVPDWLTGMRASPASPDQPSESIQPEEEGGSPDWLERIRSQQQDESPSENVEPEPQQDLPDWLRTDDLSTAGTMADWPSSIRDRAEESSSDWPQAQPSDESDEALSDWLPDSKKDDRDAAASEELPSWLKQEKEQAPSSSEDIPDWLDSGEEHTSSADEFPDWLETGESPPGEQEIESEPAPDETFVWLAGEREASPADDIPDWLQSSAESSESQEEVSGGPSGVSQGTEGESEEEWPERLKRDEEEAEEPQEEAPAWLAEGEPEAVPVEAMPDWLQPEEADLGPVDEIPDWLSEVSDQEETPETVPAELAAGDLPDWLADLDQKVGADEAEAVAAAETTGPAAEPAQELPDWLAGVGPAVAGLTEEPLEEMPDSAIAPPDTFADDEEEIPSYPIEGSYEQEVPDWLADIKASEVGLEPAEEKLAGPKDADLAPAELPSWLEAMRPVEAETATEILDERDRQVVGAGPLAGLRGVLPAEPEISKVQKPPAYSVKLQVSDMQHERASMLEELVHAEGISRPIPKRPLVSSQNLLRIVFALVLFLAILWPLVTEGPLAPVPVFAPETGAANQLIGQINSQDPVLVAVDYQPGLSGEMDAIASALLDHLMLRGAYLTLVSTTVSGPIQAEHVVTITNQQFGHSYLGAGEFTNLGYIPGGPTGLISFASNPRAMMTYALDDGRPAWENSPLQSVQNLADFALVTVITENPETARAWIEQVQPELDATPLIMAISAQAEPMVRPYYEAFPKQVQGMVVGLAGSVTYESLMGHQGLSHSYWNSFGIGLLVAIALIFIGGVFNMIPILSRGRRKNSAEREGSR
jgi:hypothetical protein